VYFYSVMKKKPKSGFSKFLRGGLILLEIAVLLPVLALLVSNQVIRVSSEAHLYDSLDELPYHHVGLVLGTSHRVRNGGPNPYFHNRMAAAADLYHSGKVRYLIVSGDNRTPYYNEPRVMRNALVDLGVPGENIYKDHAGLRTLDSVVRARDVFGQDSITIVSQRFHNQRAVYIARHHGMEVAAYNAGDVPHHNSDRTRMREWFAKTNVFWDILTNKQPQQLGDPVTIGQE